MRARRAPRPCEGDHATRAAPHRARPADRGGVVVTAATAPAGQSRSDTAAVEARLRARYPGVQLWWGPLNGSWMAAVLPPTGRQGGDRLLEAATPDGLDQQLQTAGLRPAAPQQTPPATPTPPPTLAAAPAPPPGRGRHARPQPPLRRRVAGAFIQFGDAEQ